MKLNPQLLSKESGHKIGEVIIYALYNAAFLNTSFFFVDLTNVNYVHTKLIDPND